jgi:hypothetical protein
MLAFALGTYNAINDDLSQRCIPTDETMSTMNSTMQALGKDYFYTEYNHHFCGFA